MRAVENAARSGFLFESVDPASDAQVSAITAVWNGACGPALAISERFAAYNLRPATGAVQAGHLARQGDQIIAFVLASALPNDPATMPPAVGWIDALAVLPAVRRLGIGSQLATWAEEWLRVQGCPKARLGGGLHPFFPGSPVELGDSAFFFQRSYHARPGSGRVWDVARDLGNYVRRYDKNTAVEIRPMQSQEEDKVLAFFQREFPNRWSFEFEEFYREHGRPSDYMLLRTARGVDGFARLTLEDSERPIDRFYVHGLQRPWGQLGPIGVSRAVRGQGYGGLLLDRSLLHLKECGVRGCVIDWTDLIDFYGKFGFRPYREYRMLEKVL